MYHSQKIYINDYDVNNCNDQLPKRRDFLNNDKVKEQYNKVIKGADLYFLGNDVKECLPFHDYILIISGILPCGAKTVLEITGIHPYVDVKLNQELSISDNKKFVKQLLLDEKLSYKTMEIVEGKDLFYHSFNIKKYMRVYFKNLSTRKKFINAMIDRNIETYNNELSCYYRLVSREYKTNLSSWNIISNYNDIKKKGKYKSKYQLSVDINDINPLDQDIILKDDFLVKDRLLYASYDIEMYTPDLTRIPSGKNKEDILFMLCVTFQYINATNSFLNVCFVTRECDNQNDLFTIVCDNEKTLLKLFSKLMNRMQPDFITEFNGSEFDWKVIVDKCNQFNVLKYFCKNLSIENLTSQDLELDNITSWMIKSERIKLEADTHTMSYNIKVFGYIPFDTRIIFRKLYPKEPKSSLNFYLGLLGLALKDEMDFRDMFKIYENGPSNEMARVAHYCYIDSYQLHELLLKKNVFKDKRELATMSYTNMFDSFYRADGIRVRNLIISHCLDKNLFYNNNIEETPERKEMQSIKYPGALVLNPIKGLVSNIYNLNEFITKNEYDIDSDEIDTLYDIIEDQYDNIFLRKSKKFNIDVELTDDAFNCLKKYIKYIKESEIKYPVFGLDFSSLYPSEIMARNFSPEYLITDENYYNSIKDKILVHPIKFELENINKTVNAYSVLMDDGIERATGLYPSILIYLFNERVKIKNILKPFADRLEKLDELEKDEPGVHVNTEEYRECTFQFNYYNAKQAAIKVFMNTFYGETGNAKSPLFLLPIAGGITSDGQYNLKLVKQYLEEELDVKIYYGDSVVGDTPIIIKQGHIIKFTTIKDLKWNETNRITKSGDKEIIEINSDDNIEIYTENGFTPIKKCIRHYTNKDLFRITTNSGMVIVTEDHSLLNKDKQKISPTECEIGTDLLHWQNLIYRTHDPVYNMVYSSRQLVEIICNSQLDAQIRFIVLFNRGHKNISISYENDKYVLRTNFINDDFSYNEQPDTIISIEYVGKSNDYVYDLETESHHFAAGIGRLVVHNTDSLYISCPASIYAELDKKYYTNKMSKLKYNTKLVEYTFNDVDRIKKLVNDLLSSNNGTKYLKMSYEEVLFPVVFLAKKKYFGSPHMSIANFKPSKLFIRGLEMKKRGISQLLVKICSDIMWESMDLKNIYTLKELVIKYIEVLFTTKWEISDFIKTSVWNPTKKNVRVHTFINRMTELDKNIPGIGSRFSYVVVKRYPWIYNIKGNQKKISVGDKMEYPEAIEEDNLEIDLLYYFGNELTGQFARLITYEAEYEIYKEDIIDDKATYENCKKMIEIFASKYNSKYTNVGTYYKKLYKNVSKQVVNSIAIPAKMRCIDVGNANSYEEFITKLKHNIESKNNTNMANKIIKKSKNINTMYVLFANKRNKSTYYSITMSILNESLTNVIEDLYEVMIKNKLLKKILSYNENNVANVIKFIKDQYDFDNRCISNCNQITDISEIINDDEITEIVRDESLYESFDQEQMDVVFKHILKINSIYKMILLNKQMREILMISKNKSVGITTKPPGFKY